MGGATGMRAPSASMMPRSRPNVDYLGAPPQRQYGPPGQVQQPRLPGVINDLVGAAYMGPSMPTDPNNLGAVRDWSRNYVDQMRSQRNLGPGTMQPSYMGPPLGPGTMQPSYMGPPEQMLPGGGMGDLREAFSSYISQEPGRFMGSITARPPGYMDQELAPMAGPAPMARNIALQQMSPWAVRTLRYR